MINQLDYTSSSAFSRRKHFRHSA